MEGETFADPADEEPGAADEYEELKDAVDEGMSIGFPDPARMQVVGASVNPPVVEYQVSHNARAHEGEAQPPDMGKHDSFEPADGI